MRTANRRKPLKVISLYTGTGGLDLGLEAAGFEVGASIEMDRWSCETLRHNRLKWGVIEDDIHDVSSEQILATAGLDVEEPDLLVGGPPCQPFSKSAYWARGDTKRLNDPRADTLSAYLRVLRDTRPKAFLLENVFGLAYKGKNEGLLLLDRVIKQINLETGTDYSFEWTVLNAANYGVPQIRERVFIVGARDGRRFEFPSETHGVPSAESTSLFARVNGSGLALKPWVTAWDAIGDLEEDGDTSLNVGGYWGDLLPSIPEGSNYLHHTPRGEGKALFGWRTRYWSFLLKLAKARPSWTIQAQPGSAVGPFHWKSRRLSTREMCRLQTFPDHYEVVGGRTEVQRQIGNAVPSLLAEVLGREIRRQLLDRPPRTMKPTLAIERATSTPPPESLVPVPRKYFKHIGQHKEHPGTGRGPQSSAAVQSTLPLAAMKNGGA